MSKTRIYKILQVTLISLLVVSLVLTVAGCTGTRETTPTETATPKQIIRFAELPWDTAVVANEIVTFILKHGYGYESETTPGQTILLWQALRNGDLDVQLEVFPTVQREAFDAAINEGSVVTLGYSYGTTEGWYVPTYLIKGDPSRGIEPLAPDLQTVDDLPKYWELFKDPEEPTKGRLYGGVPGWEAEKTSSIKVVTYGLDKYYNMFSAGSDTALTTSMAAAYEKGLPWLGYCWTPSWPLAKYDMTRIKESVPFNPDIWAVNRGCDWPLQITETAANAEWLSTADPEVVVFLCRFYTSTETANDYLLYLQQTGASGEQTAMWFLKNRGAIWSKWVTKDVVDKVNAALP